MSQHGAAERPLQFECTQECIKRVLPQSGVPSLHMIWVHHCVSFKEIIVYDEFARNDESIDWLYSRRYPI